MSSLNEIKEDGELETPSVGSSVVNSHSVLGGSGGVRGTGNSETFLMQFSSPFAAITALAVAACLLIMLVFVTIFAVLQVI